uniref:Wzz/FepE/Etk N-terminal domain-containing protein n=1 Tax=Thomasclavelia sp. TaxID=3025757 RepID=UPI0025FC3003
MEFQINDLDLRSIVVDLLKNSWIVVLTMLATYFLIAGYYRITYVPNYKATATVAVLTKGSTSGSYSSLKTTMNMAHVFSEVFR